MKPKELPNPKPSRQFRIQEAILILRQGKSHPLWRQAAWHLIEHAGKDTQLLLEAQRDLLLQPSEHVSPWPQRIMMGVGVIFLIVVITALVWVFLNHEYLAC